MASSYQRLRDQLLSNGVLAPVADDEFVLTRTYVFESPSAAASVLTGASRNGRTEWRTSDGTTLKELQAQSVAAPPSSAGAPDDAEVGEDEASHQLVEPAPGESVAGQLSPVETQEG
nr:DUF4357 domain-containing protein [Ornithinimicrobium sediminis]